MSNFKYILKISVMSLSTFFVAACEKPISFELNKGEVRESNKPYNLTDIQVSNAEALYIAIRDKDKNKIQSLTGETLFNELEEDPALLDEISSYIPYYEKLVSKKMIEHTETKHSKYGDLIEATFKYEYEKRTVYYSVVFMKNDSNNKIVGGNLKLEM